ncbi:MAG TPA: BON domain-containing protein [Thermoguttaceae bacterium]|nr:BON domain-containing protein [Thermoguttaceae bacterium]
MIEPTRLVANGTLPLVAVETRIAEQVARSLGATGRFGARQLDVSASHGVVTLRGRVSSYYYKQLAQTAALAVDGVRRLRNEVEVS